MKHSRAHVPKYVTLKEYLKERNRVLTRARARTRTFLDNEQNYWWYRLETLDSRHPEFKHLGIISPR